MEEEKLIPLVWETVKCKINDLLPNEINPRKISAEKKLELIQSIGKFNIVEIPARNLDGKLLSFHQRLKILQLIGRGEEMIDVRQPNRQMTEQEVKEYLLIANTHSGEWDFEKLNFEFAEILAGDFDFGISELEIERAGEQLEVEDDNFEEPDLALVATSIVPGDLIEIGNHRLLCGDSTNADHVARLMDGRKANMIFTDPPYNVKISGLGSGTYKQSIGKIHGEFKMASGEMTREEFISFLSSCFELLIAHSTDGSIHFVCMDWRHIYEIIMAGELYTEFKQLCVWNKDNGGMGAFYRSKHELVFVFKNGTGKHINTFGLGGEGRYRTNVWDYPSVSSFAAQQRDGNKSVGNQETKMHPTVKPLKMVGDAILDCSHPEMIIMDLFGGSGTTIAASHQLKRLCYAMEIEPKYCQVTIDRMLKLDPDVVIKINGEIYKPAVAA